MRTIKLNLPEHEIAQLDEVAKLSNVSRADIIRDRIRTTAPNHLTLERYQHIVSRVVHTSGINLPRTQIESLVACVVAEINR